MSDNLFETIDGDGDRLVGMTAEVYGIDESYAAVVTAKSNGYTSLTTYLTAEDVTTVRAALAPLDPEWKADPEPVDDDLPTYEDGFGTGYSEGHADGFAEGMDEALGAPFIIRKKALQAAAEVAKGLRGGTIISTNQIAALDVITYAAFLLGELPPLTDDDDLADAEASA